METGKITLTDEDGVDIDFYILEQTELAGETYLLVTDSDDESEEEAEALILREGVNEDENVIYETVEDEGTLLALSKLFEELMEETAIELE